MNYPLISEYTEAILSAEDNFNELTDLRPVFDSGGRPIMSSGNFAVVYKMRDIKTEKLYAVKCFTRDQVGRERAYGLICDKLKDIHSQYFVQFSYHQAELYVDSSQSDETEYPIVLMEWVEGMTLDKYIDKFRGNPFVLYELCYNFRMMAKWLVSQNIAHGDIKPDNILIREDTSIVLIDYDGMFVGSMCIDTPREQGTPDFRNPYRNNEFNEHIDDYALAVISLALKLISAFYDILDDYHTKGNGFLISKEEALDIENSDIFSFIRNNLFSEPNLSFYYSTFIKSLGYNHLSETDFTIKSEKTVEDLLKYWPSNVDIDDKRKLEEGVLEANGVIYTKDGTGVIGFINRNINEDMEIFIKEGVIFFYEDCLRYDTPKLKWHLPSTLRYFSPKSFDFRYGSLSWSTPWYTYQNGVIYTKDKTEAILQHLKDVYFDSNTLIFGRYIFNRLRFEGNWPENVKVIRNGAFEDSIVSSTFAIAEGVTTLGKRAFAGCSASKINLPSTLLTMGEYCFHMCKNLEQVTFNPDCLLETIPAHAFVNNKSLIEVVFSNRLKTIGKSAFQWCYKIKEIPFPSSLEVIDEDAFSMSSILGDKYESELTTIQFPAFMKRIGENAFSYHQNLSNVTFTSYIDEIGNKAFFDCPNLTSLKHKGIKHIKSKAFSGCNINFDNLEDVVTIAPGALNGCTIQNVDGSSFKIKDDCLYSENFKELIYCWSKDSTVEIEEGVKDIQPEAFLYKPIALILPNSFDEENLGHVSFVPVLVAPKHFKERNGYEGSRILHEKVYVDSDGVIYSEDKKTLILFPLDLNIETYTILDGCEIIKEHAFQEEVDPDPEFGVSYFGNKLRHLYLPQTLRKIESASFTGCHELTDIIIPNSVTEIGLDAFSSCDKISEVVLPNSLTDLGESAFASVTKVILPTNGYLRFESGCLLTSDDILIQIPSDVKSLSLPDIVSFHGKKCRTYKHCLVTLDGELIWTVPKIEHFTIPDAVSRIGTRAFSGNDKIKELIIPEGVIEIGYYAFGYNQALEDIYLPTTMKIIHDLKTYQGWGRKYFKCFYPKRVHIPKGMRNHFKKLLPGILDSHLIEY